ncbi:MAG TPA: His/Gly/Thr/Pro-type tRNA ligase C-terminal domain-containing protein, partial [Bacteroidales bacterium]|nr:His/Gly/Thr/Pro-type tRNA ligase C-terminal domain-containing protein [Bacteroidales bacterium]HQF05413.1 His/Gly/Thr/Pro-type tRNA ligase C-terminal domain-containing protein [Bacteroidales bacterium]
EKYNDFAKKVCDFLNNCELRASLDDRNETVGKRIRENELKRIPYLLVVGEKEESAGTVSVRRQGEGDKGTMKTEEFAALLRKEIKESIN